ncbi:MAG: AraC family transcriptional regulator [Huintestinicola sp.]
MENNTERIILDTVTLPILSDCDILTASEDFYHMDRVADFNVMIYVDEGVMYVTENGRDYEIAPGELLFLRSGIRHFGKRKTLRGTRWFYAHFYLENNLSEGTEAVVLPKKTSGLGDSILKEKIIELCSYFHGSDPSKNFRRNIMLYELLLMIGFGEEMQPKSLCDRICGYLDSQTDKPFTRELVEKEFFLSYSRLSARFRNEKNMSMGDYHNSARMKKACNLLRSTLLPVSEIAERLGFPDALYFSKKFHAFTGISPSDYRKQMQNRY